MRKLIYASDKTALMWRDMNISYSELLCSVDLYFKLLGDGSPEKVMIFSENRPEYIYALYAGLRKNSVIVPADYLSTPEELLYMIDDCLPEILFTSAECLPKVKAALKAFSPKGEGLRPKVIVFERIKASGRDLKPLPVTVSNPEKTALIIYTSGTTGSPKGVMLSFKNLFCNIDAVVKAGIYNPSECFLVLLPIHHILPLLGSVIAPLTVQARLAISPSVSTDDILATLQNGRVTGIIGVPRLYEALSNGIIAKINERAIGRLLFKLADKFKSQAFSKKVFWQVHRKFGGSLKHLVSGGASLDPQVGRNFTALGFSVLEGYGMTEAAPMIAFPRPNNIKLTTAGQPLPGIKIKIRNGEILAKGDNIMQGYYKKPKETAEVLKGGWLHTGDLGVLDEDNFLTITGRKKDILVLPNGKNINPEEIEEKLARYPEIAETAVFLDDNKLKAIIRFDETKAPAGEELRLQKAYDIISRYNGEVSSYKRLMSYGLIDTELPKTRLGKIKRFELAAIGRSGEKKKVKEPTYKEYVIIRDFLKQETGKGVNPDDHFEFDLGLDSLSKVGLLVFLEKTFGLKLKDEQLNSYPNLLKLSAFVKEKKIKLQENFASWTDILKEKAQVKLPKSWFTTELFQYTGKGLFKVLFNLKTRGKQNIPKAPPFILAPNHQSFIDPLFVTAFLKRSILKNTFFYAKAKYFNNRFLKFITHINNIVLVDINNDLKGSIQILAEILKEGKNILIFPEGTRTRTGIMGEFKHTFAILSKELNVPVVPVAISGAYSVMPPGKWLPKPFKQVSVDFLNPVKPGKKTYLDISNAVKEAISRKLDSLNASQNTKKQKSRN